jgi:hypothetical protein
MTRKRPVAAALRGLFARSGNRCAFPDCTRWLVNEDDLLVAEVCHIHAASPGGPRYSRGQSDDSRHGGANLVLLCHEHHVVVDADPSRYTAVRLRFLKARHEDKYRTSPYRIPPKTLRLAAQAVEEYWRHTEAIGRKAVRGGEPALEVRRRAKDRELIGMARSRVRRLQEEIPQFTRDAPTQLREIASILVPNCLLDLELLLAQLAVRSDERTFEAEPRPLLSARRLAASRRTLETLVRGRRYSD